MKQPNELWGKCIRELLEKYDLSYRAAALKAGRPSLRSYIGDWVAGLVPSYEIATDFLRHFPVEDAAKCLNAAGYAVSPEWTKDIADPAEAVRVTLIGRPDMTDDEVADLVEAVKRHLAKKQKG